jgi:glycosyltransferase involved in cell wall biosynthesis
MLPPGGDLAVMAWILEALKEDYSLSLLTWEPPDFEQLNRFYGSALKASDFEDIRWANPALRAIINLDPDVGSFQKVAYLIRVCRRIKDKYDVMMTADNEVDFGCRGIQYLHYPYMGGKITPLLDSSWLRKIWEAFRGNYRPWMLFSGFSYLRMKENLTLVNSDWTGRKVKESYGIEPITVYPPVPGFFPEVPWERRENGFVCLGRFHPCKKFERAIEIVKRVRAVGKNDIHLHLIGCKAYQPEGVGYYEKLKKITEANSSWISLDENLSREELVSLLACHRYGIHALETEHFGIAVAEILRAGCIVFVPNDGGQVEIVGGDERLVYASEEEAAQKIIRVMSNPEEQNAICAYLNQRREMFSTERFMRDIQRVVGQF